jgi:hypothetical protein
MKDMMHTTAMLVIQVDSKTYEARAVGGRPDREPKAQRCFLF